MAKLSQGAAAVLIELLKAQGPHVNEHGQREHWDRDEWAESLCQMQLEAFQMARIGRADAAIARGANPILFGTPWEKIPTLLARAMARVLAAHEDGDRLQLVNELLVMGAQLLLVSEECPIWQTPEEGQAKERTMVREYVAGLKTQAEEDARVLN